MYLPDWANEHVLEIFSEGIEEIFEFVNFFFIELSNFIITRLTKNLEDQGTLDGASMKF